MTLRIGQKIANDILCHIKVDKVTDDQASISCPYLFYMTDEEFKKKYLGEK